LLEKLGYISGEPENGPVYRHPQGRRAIFVGDLVDRGPDSPGVLRLVMNMVQAGHALAVPGNHDLKLVKKLAGRDVKIAHGLAQTLEQLDALPEAERKPFCQKARIFLDKLVSHLWLDDGRLVVAHAGMKEEMQGRGSGAVRPVWRDKRGDRRLRLASAIELGSRLSRQGHGGLRPHTHPGCRMDQQHGLHRHWLRIWRKAHGFALS
jgi:hypothetical protein